MDIDCVCVWIWVFLLLLLLDRPLAYSLRAVLCGTDLHTDLGARLVAGRPAKRVLKLGVKKGPEDGYLASHGKRKD